MTGEQERFFKLYQEANAAQRFRIPGLRRGQSEFDSCSASAKARENARTIRDRISREMWEDINGLYHTRDALSARKKRSPSGRIASATRSSSAATAFTA